MKPVRAPSRSGGDPAEAGQPRGSSPGRPTLAELERRKAKVMEVATRLFAQRGYTETTLVDIAKEAGVATRTLYQHFGDKESIFFDVLTAREHGAVYPAPAIPPDASLSASLHFIAGYVMDVALRPKSVELMRLIIAESHRFPEFVVALCDKTVGKFQNSVAGMFETLIDHGQITGIDPSASAEIFLDLILGNAPLTVYAGLGAHPLRDEKLKAKIDFFIRGIGGAAAD